MRRMTRHEVPQQPTKSVHETPRPALNAEAFFIVGLELTLETCPFLLDSRVGSQNHIINCLR